MCSQIGTEDGQYLWADLMTLSQQLPEHFCHYHYIVEDHQVGHQMIVFNDFVLFITPILHDEAFPAKEHTVQKAVKQLTLVEGAQDEPAQLSIGKILQQEARADGPSQLP